MILTHKGTRLTQFKNTKLVNLADLVKMRIPFDRGQSLLEPSRKLYETGMHAELIRAIISNKANGFKKK